MNTRHLDRLMNRASVAAMAAFAPKPEPVSTLPAFAERVEESDAGGAGDDIGGDLSAEERAQFDAMQRGEAPAAGDDAGGGAGDDGAGGDHGADDGDGGDDGVDDGGGDDAGRDPGAGDAGTERPAEAPRRPKTINYGRHQREIGERDKQLKEARDALEAERVKTARLDERTRMLAEAFNASKAGAPAPAAAAASTVPAADADPEPNADDDPIGHLQWQNRKLVKTVEALQTGQQQRTEREAQESEDDRLARTYIANIESAAKTDPNAADAFIHLRESRYRELGFVYAGIDVNDPAQTATLSPADQIKLSGAIQGAFEREQRLVAKQAIEAGRRPADVVMNLAIARGFQRKAAPAAGADDAAAAASAAAAAAEAARAAAPAGGKKPVVKPTVTDELASIRDGREASMSLSDAGGSPGGGVDLSRLADMPDDEFEAMYNQISGNPRAKAQFDRALGKIPQ